MLANAVALAHALLPLSVVYFAAFGPSRLAWVAPAIVLLFFLNWHVDPENKCFLTRLEAHLRDMDAHEFGGYMWRYLGSHLHTDKDRFYFGVNLVYLMSALLGLARFVDWARRNGCLKKRR